MGWTEIHEFVHSFSKSVRYSCHCSSCQKKKAQTPPLLVTYRLRCHASSLKFQYLFVSLRSTDSCLRLIRCLLFTSVLPSDWEWCPWGHPTAAYVLFFVFSSLLSFLQTGSDVLDVIQQLLTSYSLSSLHLCPSFRLEMMSFRSSNSCLLLMRCLLFTSVFPLDWEWCPWGHPTAAYVLLSVFSSLLPFLQTGNDVKPILLTKAIFN
jgi:hypothetical protein